MVRCARHATNNSRHGERDVSPSPERRERVEAISRSCIVLENWHHLFTPSLRGREMEPIEVIIRGPGIEQRTRTLT
jgi:hypothetical protein